MTFCKDKFRWRKLDYPRRLIALMLPLIIALLLLALTLPNNFNGQNATANPGPIISVRCKGTVPDGAPKSREYVKQAGYTGNTRTQTSESPKICVKEFDISIKELEISAKGEACVKKVTTWTEREWKETKVTWLEQPWRTIWVAVYFGGIEVDSLLQDDTWQSEVPGSRTEITETRWERVANSETSKLVDPPGNGDPLSKQVFIQDSQLDLDFSFIDNIIPNAPPGTITHRLYLDGVIIADNTTIDLKNLTIGDHELMVELITIDGQLIPISIPFTIIPPLEMVLNENSEVTLDEMKRFEFTLKNNTNSDTRVNLDIEGIPPGWDVHLGATSVLAPLSGESTFQVLVRPTIGAFPQYSMNAVLTATSISGYQTTINLDVQAVFPDDVTTYQFELQGEKILAFSLPQSTSLTNFRIEDGKILFESEQADTGFGLIIPRTLIEGPLQATDQEGNVLSSFEDLFLSGTYELFTAESEESDLIEISKKVETEPESETDDELTSEIIRLSNENTKLKKDISELNTKVQELTEERDKSGGSPWVYLIIGIIAGLIVGGLIIFILTSRKKEEESKR